MSVAVAVSSIVASDPSQGLDATQNEQIVEGTLTLSGNYGGGSTHGDTINFAGPLVSTQQPPRKVDIFQVPTSGTGPIHYAFLYGQGTTQLNGVLIVVDTTTGLEISEGAGYPAALTAAGANIRFRAWFPKFI